MGGRGSALATARSPSPSPSPSCSPVAQHNTKQQVANPPATVSTLCKRPPVRLRASRTTTRTPGIEVVRLKAADSPAAPAPTTIRSHLMLDDDDAAAAAAAANNVDAHDTSHNALHRAARVGRLISSGRGARGCDRAKFLSVAPARCRVFRLDDGQLLSLNVWTVDFYDRRRQIG